MGGGPSDSLLGVDRASSISSRAVVDGSLCSFYGNQALDGPRYGTRYADLSTGISLVNKENYSNVTY